jgi:ubiquinone/menaquinone biosynthesis C-methylase UbiE
VSGRPARALAGAARRSSAPDAELDAGARAHYDDPGYYTSTYRRRIDDVQFYVHLAEKSGGPVLEYGVGNGRIALPIARHGVVITGVDHSRPMLADLRERLDAETAHVRRRLSLRHGDMRRLKLGKRFPLVICPFNTALHLYTRQDVEAFLARVHEHITPRGELVVDLSVPVMQDLLRDPTRPFKAPRFKHPTTGEVVHYTEHFDYDKVRQVLFVAMEFSPNGDDARAWMTPLAHRQFFPREWEALLHYNGFEVDKVSGDFYGGRFDRTSDVMVWHARPRRAGARRGRP